MIVITEKFIKEPIAGDKIKVYLGINGERGAMYGYVLKVDTQMFIEKGMEVYREMVIIDRVNKVWDLWETNFFFPENRVILAGN